MKGVDMCENSGAKKIWGEGRITNDNKPDNFHGDASEGIYMWPHVYVDVTEDMECFHEEIFGPLVTIVKARDFDLHCILQMHHHTVCHLRFTRMIDWKPIDTSLESRQV